MAQSAKHPARTWAKSFPKDKPIWWGEVERAVLGLPIPEKFGLQRSPTLNATPKYLVFAMLVLPLASLVFVVIGIATRDTAVVAFSQVTTFGSLATFLMPLLSSWETKRREPGNLLFLAIGLVLMFTATLLIWLALSGAAWAGILGVIVTAVGVVSFVIMWKFRSAPYDVPREAREWTQQELWQANARKIVLEVFEHRGIVTKRDIDVRSMLEMPLGSWHTLDR